MKWSLLLLLAAVTSARADDWPQLLGPMRNGVSTETNFASVWPKEGPRRAWKASVGEGWSAPVVSRGRLIAFHRQGGDEIVDCLNATNGTRVWRSSYATSYRDDFGFEEGPRATPAIDGDRVFTFSADGVLNAWSFTMGSNLWRIDTRKQFGADKGFFGIACSPLVHGGALILNVGGSDRAGIAAFDSANGRTLWTATTQEASYSSPVVAPTDDGERLLVLGRSALVALTPAGKVLWEHPFRPRINASVTAATPLVISGNEPKVFISASYGAGAALLKVTGTKPEVVWSGDDILSNHYATSVHHGGFFTASMGDRNSAAVCVAWSSPPARCAGARRTSARGRCSWLTASC